MSMRFAILGLLAEQPLHGYAIHTALEERFGDLCEPSHGIVYRVLTVLERGGMVTRSAARIGNRPRRNVYTLTQEGRDALQRWLLGPDASVSRPRDGLPFRLLIAEGCAPELLPRVLEAHARHGRSQLAELEDQRRSLRPAASFGALVRALRLESELRQVRTQVAEADRCREIVVRYRAGVAIATIAREMTTPERDDHLASVRKTPRR